MSDWPERGICRVCHESIRLDHGLVVAHSAIEIKYPGQTARVCPGSAKPPVDYPSAT